MRTAANLRTMTFTSPAGVAQREHAMEFHIRMAGPMPDMHAIDVAIRDVDPAAVIDLNLESKLLRVAAAMDAAELVSLVNATGYTLGPDQVSQLPSICCGGCGG
jgi:hypothetical protein